MSDSSSSTEKNTIAKQSTISSFSIEYDNIYLLHDIQFGRKWDLSSCYILPYTTDTFDISDENIWVKGRRGYWSGSTWIDEPQYWSVAPADCTEPSSQCLSEMQACVLHITDGLNYTIIFDYYDPYGRLIYTISMYGNNFVSWNGRFGERDLPIEIYKPGNYYLIISTPGGNAKINFTIVGTPTPNITAGGYKNTTDSSYSVGQSFTAVHVSNPIEKDGQINRWAIYGLGNSPQAKLKIFRGGHIGTRNPSQPTLIYSSPLQALTQGWNKFTISPPLDVLRGDIIGIYMTPYIPFGAYGNGSTAISSGDVVDTTGITFGSYGYQGYELMVRAYAEATVLVKGTTGGNVQVYKNGVLQGTVTTTDTPFIYNVGDTFTFTANPNSGYTFNKFCTDTSCTIYTTSNPFNGTITVLYGEVHTFFNAPLITEVPNTRSFSDFDANTYTYNIINICNQYLVNLHYIAAEFEISTSSSLYFDVSISYTKNGVNQTPIYSQNIWTGSGNIQRTQRIMILKNPWILYTVGNYVITGISIYNIRTA